MSFLERDSLDYQSGKTCGGSKLPLVSPLRRIQLDGLPPSNISVRDDYDMTDMTVRWKGCFYMIQTNPTLSVHISTEQSLITKILDIFWAHHDTPSPHANPHLKP